MLLEIGVPVAKVTPLPPVISSRYWHLANISEDFCASVCAIPVSYTHLDVYKRQHCHKLNEQLQTWLLSLIFNRLKMSWVIIYNTCLLYTSRCV